MDETDIVVDKSNICRKNNLKCLPCKRIITKHRHSTKVKGIYTHYKKKYQKIQQRIKEINLKKFENNLIFDDRPNTSYFYIGKCRHIIRYAASAPEKSIDCSFCDDNNILNNDDDDYLSDEVSIINNNNNQYCIKPNKNLIQELIEVDRLEQLLNLKGLQIRNNNKSNSEEITTEASLKLSKIGDEIVEQLVEWTKLLPFYNELPVEVHTHLLTQRWSELVLISACFYAICTRCDRAHEIGIDQPSFDNVNINIMIFQRRLSLIMNKHIPIENVIKEAGNLIEKFTNLLNIFSKLKITLEAYVCLKAIALVHYGQPTTDDEKLLQIHKIYSPKVQLIQDQFVKALQIHLSQYENGPRLSDLLNFLPILNSTAIELLNSKMFYVPFLICREPDKYNDDYKQNNNDTQSEANCTSSSISDYECIADL